MHVQLIHTQLAGTLHVTLSRSRLSPVYCDAIALIVHSLACKLLDRLVCVLLGSRNATWHSKQDQALVQPRQELCSALPRLGHRGDHPVMISLFVSLFQQEHERHQRTRKDMQGRGRKALFGSIRKMATCCVANIYKIKDDDTISQPTLPASTLLQRTLSVFQFPITNGGLARRHAVALKIEKPGAKGCLGGIASAGWLEDHQIQSFSREKLFELCKKTLLFLKF